MVTSDSACTGPKCFWIPCSLRSSVPLGPPGARPAGPGRAPASTPELTALAGPGWSWGGPARASSAPSVDTVPGAVGFEALGAELADGDELVGDDRTLHVGGGDPFRRQEHRGDVLVGRRVERLAVEQRRRRGHAGPQEGGQGDGGLRLLVDGLVDGAALVARDDVLQADEGGVLARRREGVRLDPLCLEVPDDGRTVLVVG